VIRRSGLAVCLAALSLNGCVPIPTTYDEVSAPEGTVLDCPGLKRPTGGPLTVLDLARGPAEVIIDARSLASSRELHIYILTDSRRLMKPDWDRFRMVDLGTGKPISLTDP